MRNFILPALLSIFSLTTAAQATLLDINNPLRCRAQLNLPSP